MTGWAGREILSTLNGSPVGVESLFSGSIIISFTQGTQIGYEEVVRIDLKAYHSLRSWTRATALHVTLGENCRNSDGVKGNKILQGGG